MLFLQIRLSGAAPDTTVCGGCVDCSRPPYGTPEEGGGSEADRVSGRCAAEEEDVQSASGKHAGVTGSNMGSYASNISRGRI